MNKIINDLKSNSESIINEYMLRREEEKFFEEKNYIFTRENIDKLSIIY